jgi:hypothetical protein
MVLNDDIKAMGDVRRQARLKSWQQRQPDAIDEFSYSGEKWEYMFETLSESNAIAEDELNMFGAQGWELVTIDFTQCLAYFKRKADQL